VYKLQFFLHLLRIRELEVKNYAKSGKVGEHSIIGHNNELYRTNRCVRNVCKEFGQVFVGFDIRKLNRILD